MQVSIPNTKSVWIDDFSRSLSYKRSAVAESLFEDLAHIKSLDEDAEFGQKAAFTAGIACIIGLLLSGQVPPAFSMVFVLLCWLGIIIFFMSAFRYMGSNVANERYILAGKLLEMLMRDCDQDMPLTLEFDGRKPVKRDEHHVRAVTGGDLYAQEWLRIEGVFLDGTEFAFSLKEMFKINYYKSKHKKKGFRIDLDLTLNDKLYRKTPQVVAVAKGKPSPAQKEEVTPYTQTNLAKQWLRQVQDQPQYKAPTNISAPIVHLPNGCRMSELKAHGKKFKLTCRLADALLGFVGMNSSDEMATRLYNVSASMFLSAYHTLNLTRHLARSEKMRGLEGNA